MVQLYRRITVLMAALWMIGASVTALLHWRTFVRVQEDERRSDGRAALLAADRILARIEYFGKLASALASSAQFETPQDLRLDRVRSENVTQAQARNIALYDGITTWLPVEFGPASPLNAAIPRRLSVWQVARGLPIRAPNGSLLARSRRLLAERTIAENPEIQHIAELDSLGRIVFLVPYTLQVRLGAFNESRSILALDTALGSGVASTLLHEGLVLGSDAKVISFMAPIKRSTGTAHLLVTVERKIRSELSAQTEYGLFDSSNQLLMYSGDEPNILQAMNRPQNFASVNVSPGSRVVALHPRSSIRASFTESFGAITGFYLLIFILLNFAAFRLVLWISKFQRKLDHMRTHIQRNVQDLAHAFQNRLLTLRTLMGDTSGRLDLDQFQRLSGAVTDLSGFTDQLSTELVRDSFASMDSVGPATEVPAEVGTYLRGTLETVVQQQAATFGHSIPILFSPEFGGREPFVGISRAGLTRIVSNLLRNSIEACAQAGTENITLSVCPKGHDVGVQMIDRGCGIASENQGHIFDPGFSTKGEGRGKGLANAVELARQWGATVRLVESSPGKGAILELRLVTRPTPNWFVNSITLTGSSVLVIVDDDGDVFDYWNKTIAGRLEGINLPPDRRPRLISFTGPGDLRANRDSALNEGTLFLVDYKFKDEQTTGVELIEEFGLEGKAILVTHHVEQPDVVRAVARLKIGMLPKTYMLNAKFPLDIGGD